MAGGFYEDSDHASPPHGPPRRRQRPVPPRVTTRSAASPRAAACPRTPPTASRPCCASSCRTSSPSTSAVLFDPPGRTFRHEQYAEYKANRPAMDERPRRAAALHPPGVRGLPPADRRGAGLRGRRRDRDPRRPGGRRRVPGRGGHGRQGHAPARERRGRGPQPRPRGDGGDPPRRARRSRRSGACRRSGSWTSSPSSATRSTTCPACPGIGDKGARDLVREFGPVESVIANADKVKRAAYREGLKAHAEEALLSKQLVTLRRDVPVSLDLDAIVRREPDRAACHALFKELEFQVAREGVRAGEAARGRRPPHRPRRGRRSRRAVAEARAAGRVALGVVVTSGPRPMRARLLGVSLSWAAGPVRLRPSRPRRARGAGRAARGRGARRACGRCSRTRSVRKASAHSKRDLDRPRPRRGRPRRPGLRRPPRLVPARPRPAHATRSRTSPSSTSASVGRRRRRASPPRTLPASAVAPVAGAESRARPAARRRR